MSDPQPTAGELRDLIGGVYRIAAWYEDDGAEQRPPIAHGRYVLVDGQVVSSLFKMDPDGTKTVQALYGRYEIEDGAFIYGYDFGTLTTMRPDGATELTEIDAGPPMRFAATRETDAIHLWSVDRNFGFHVTSDVMEFFEGDRLRRVWERVTA